MPELIADADVFIPFREIPSDPRMARLRRSDQKRGAAKLNYSTIWRWANRGVGGVKLRFVKIGQTPVVKWEWLEDFFERLANPNPDAHRPTVAEINRRHQEAERELELAGI